MWLKQWQNSRFQTTTAPKELHQKQLRQKGDAKIAAPERRRQNSCAKRRQQNSCVNTVIQDYHFWIPSCSSRCKSAMCKIFRCCSRSVAPVESVQRVDDVEIRAIYTALKYENEKRLRRDREENGNDDQDDDGDPNPKQACQKLYEFIIQKSDDGEILYRLKRFRCKTDDSDDTLLHTATLLEADDQFIELLMIHCPDLALVPRTGSYEGQTPLHITLAHKNQSATKIILDNLKSSEMRQDVLAAKATGPMFNKNVMMGETALSVAVVTLDTEMVDLLIGYKASLNQVNSKGDTVVHTLIKYAEQEPEKIPEVIKMLEHLDKKIKGMGKSHKGKEINTESKRLGKGKAKKRNKQIIQQDLHLDKDDNSINEHNCLVENIWFKENNERETPLKLAVSCGLIDIFNALMKLEDVFYFPADYDGCFDKKYYDITEIDHVNQYVYNNKTNETLLQNKKWFSKVLALFKFIFLVKRPESIVEMISNVGWKHAQPFVETEIIETIISKRWESSKYYYFYPFWFMHICVMFLYTTSIYYRKITTNSAECDCRVAKSYSDFVPWLLLCYSLYLIISELRRVCFFSHLWVVGKHHNNNLYRVLLVLFAVVLFLDCFLYYFKHDSNDVFVIVLLSGAWFFMFFLKGSEKFASYIVLFQKVLFGDFLRFGAIICIEFIAFTFAMYIVLKGNGNVEEFSTFENTTLTMFGYMLGLKDLEILVNVEAGSQHLVAVIYVLFILTTYLLLINSLIAMLSNTCEELFRVRKSLATIQKSTVITFIDGFKFTRHVMNDVPESSEISTRLIRNRYYILIKTEQTGKHMKEELAKRNFTLGEVLRKQIQHSFMEEKNYESTQRKNTKTPKVTYKSKGTQTVWKSAKHMEGKKSSAQRIHSQRESTIVQQELMPEFSSRLPQTSRPTEQRDNNLSLDIEEQA
ncbi:transient receptor potential cation channel subfamily V member 4 [Biomphalaria pfeifferi]|uniref:Transient receptor potential cation channel subfamily V member 4 n=1 Tax=Biomphalaria pfeifferi TaxID=112525 RepID=A0AAD8BT54_BIOPF|nr:transient receptor potential cation channel subfamily V member 4 [Biomphalaria pfeifferi]